MVTAHLVPACHWIVLWIASLGGPPPNHSVISIWVRQHILKNMNRACQTGFILPPLSRGEHQNIFEISKMPLEHQNIFVWEIYLNASWKQIGTTTGMIWNLHSMTFQLWAIPFNKPVWVDRMDLTDSINTLICWVHSGKKNITLLVPVHTVDGKKSCTSWYGKYHIIYKVLYKHPSWCRISSINSMNRLGIPIPPKNVGKVPPFGPQVGRLHVNGF